MVKKSRPKRRANLPAKPAAAAEKPPLQAPHDETAPDQATPQVVGNRDGFSGAGDFVIIRPGRGNIVIGNAHSPNEQTISFHSPSGPDSQDVPPAPPPPRVKK